MLGSLPSIRYLLVLVEGDHVSRSQAHTHGRRAQGD